MADNLDIEREVKPGEANFKKVGEKTFDRMFRDNLVMFEQKYTKLHQPFDRACAKLDFEDKYKSIMKETERREGSVDYKDLKIDMGDLDRYADPKRFTKLTESQDEVNRTVDGVTTPVIISVTESFVCKHRGHKISVATPITDWRKAHPEATVVNK